jgi:hypothetical protein
MTTGVLEAPVARPWRTIWFWPRDTMRAILDAEVRPSWVAVVGLAALHGALGTIVPMAANGSLSFNRAVMPTLIEMLQLIFGVLVGPFLLAFSGGWFGGQADPEEIRHSVAWSYAPIAITAILWVPVLIAFSYGPIQNAAAPETAADSLKILLLLVMVLISFAATVWTLVLQVVTLAEVQRFSILRAIGSVAVFLIPLLLLLLVT